MYSTYKCTYTLANFTCYCSLLWCMPATAQCQLKYLECTLNSTFISSTVYCHAWYWNVDFTLWFFWRLPGYNPLHSFCAMQVMHNPTIIVCMDRRIVLPSSLYTSACILSSKVHVHVYTCTIVIVWKVLDGGKKTFCFSNNWSLLQAASTERSFSTFFSTEITVIVHARTITLILCNTCTCTWYFCYPNTLQSQGDQIRNTWLQYACLEYNVGHVGKWLI